MAAQQTRTIPVERLEAELAGIGIDPQTADWSRVAEKTRKLMADETAKRFDQERGPDGRFWAALAESTRKQKRNPKKLQESGLLRAQASSIAATRATKTGAGLTVEQTADGLPKRGLFHQLGTRHMPARPFFGVSDAQADRVANLVADDLAGQVMGRPA